LRRHFAKGLLRRRVIALVAAYAIAFAGLISSFGAASTAAASAATPGGVICHTDVIGQQAPASDQDGGKVCVDNCCVGCLILMAALPPPPTKAVGAPQSSGQRLEPLAITVPAIAPHTTSHRSRAPPLAA
jgi:hypothetical protein